MDDGLIPTLSTIHERLTNGNFDEFEGLSAIVLKGSESSSKTRPGCSKTWRRIGYGNRLW